MVQATLLETGGIHTMAICMRNKKSITVLFVTAPSL
jgi:hypothetical protein